MNIYGKILVVFTAAASITFLGATAISLLGGPNWSAEAAELPGYTIEEVAGEKPTWKVTERVSGQNIPVTKSEVHAAAIIAARKHLGTELDKKTQANNAKTTELKNQLAEAVKLREMDIEAMKKREAELAAQLEEVNQKIVTTQTETVRKSQEAQSIRAEAGKRRGDVYRLKRELEEIRAEQYTANEQLKQLRDSLIRLDGVIQPLERRQKQLENNE